MKFTIDYPFTIEVGDDVYKGTLSEPTKKQSKDMKALSENFIKLGKEAKKIENKIEVLRARFAKDNTDEKVIEELQKSMALLDDKIEQLDGFNLVEEVSKMRLELCMKGDKEIMELAREYGYSAVLDTIQKDIEEKKKDASKA